MEYITITTLIVSSIELLLLLLSVLIATFQYKKVKKDSKAQYISNIYASLTNKNDLEIFDHFDTESILIVPGKCAEIDSYLFKLENILFLQEKNIISSNELMRFDYFLKKCILSKSIDKYFFDLKSHCYKHHLSFPFPLIEKYKEEHKGLWEKQ